MITLLLGSDSLAKKQYIAELAQSSGAEVDIYTNAENLPKVYSLFEQQLFGAPKLVVFDHVWKELDLAALLLKTGDSKNGQLLIIEDSLDKRVKINQEFLKDSRVKVVECKAPIGTAETAKWIGNFAKTKQIKMTASSSIALARTLLVDEDATLDVVRAGNELEKLKQFATTEGDGTITGEMVSLLVENVTGVDVFALLNSIATKNKKSALQMLETFFDTEAADEKTNSIKVTALLADQFRSLLIALDADARRMPDAEVLKLTGWKSGRLFMMKKLSRNFTISKVKQAMSKLGNLDRELKTSTMPPHVILDLIIADM
jgi:DNA polymerase III subunit delta